jgi:predicted SAM-dependent methyltransferase
MPKVIIEPLKLNLGSRDRAMKGFQNMDIDAHEGVDFVGDVSDLSRFENESVEEIFSSHILEHFEHTRTEDVLKEWFRVLKPMGKLYVAVPDFRRCVELYFQVGLNQWIVNFLCGDQGYKTAFHYNLFDEPRLSQMLKRVGFVEVYRVDEFEMSLPRDCSNLASTHDGERVSLNLVAIKGSNV